MPKFLLNLLLQISKALVNSKIQFLIQKFFFLTFGPADLVAHSAFEPANLLASLPPQAETPSPAHPACASVASLREYVFPFGSRLPSWPPLPRLSIKRAPAISSVPHLRPPELAPTATASWPPRAAQLRASGATEPLPPHLHFPSLNFPLKPSPIFNGVKAINAGVNPPWPPLPGAPLTRIKGEHHPRSSPHLSQPLFASLHARASLSPSAATSGSAPPSPRLHAAARAPVRPEPSSPCSSLSFAPPPVSFGAPERPEVVLR
jgi:hypothetical protein